MLKEFKLILILLLVVPLLASCAGTGTKEFSTIQKTAGDQSTSVFFVRETTFVAGGVGANIFMDGQQIGTLGSGEMIRMFDSNGSLVDKVECDNMAPWPIGPDGTGATLELIHPSLENDMAANWAASNGNGTPGEINSVYNDE